MGGRGELIDKIKTIFQKIFGDKQHNQKRKYIIAIALIGVLLILISNVIQPNKEPNPNINEEMEVATKEQEDTTSSLIEDVEEMELYYEKTLQAMLNEITGVSDRKSTRLNSSHVANSYA